MSQNECFQRIRRFIVTPRQGSRVQQNKEQPQTGEETKPQKIETSTSPISETAEFHRETTHSNQKKLCV